MRITVFFLVTLGAIAACLNLGASIVVPALASALLAVVVMLVVSAESRRFSVLQQATVLWSAGLTAAYVAAQLHRPVWGAVLLAGPASIGTSLVFLSAGVGLRIRALTGQMQYGYNPSLLAEFVRSLGLRSLYARRWYRHFHGGDWQRAGGPEAMDLPWIPVSELDPSSTVMLERAGVSITRESHSYRPEFPAGFGGYGVPPVPPPPAERPN